MLQATCLFESAVATEEFGRLLGSRLQGGEVIELSSDLGGGKTTFTRGLAAGAGSDDQVSSPTFTISKLYQAGAIRIHHFDFYRLPQAGVMADELAELIADPTNVIVVEWSDIVRDVLPDRRLRLSIQAVGEQSRQMIISCPDDMAYLLPDDMQMQSEA